jgi:hypothetical protein
MTIHLFISEALVSVAMYARIKQGGGPVNQRTPHGELLAQVSFLSQVRILYHGIAMLIFRQSDNLPSSSEANLFFLPKD